MTGVFVNSAIKTRDPRHTNFGQAQQGAKILGHIETTYTSEPHVSIDALQCFIQSHKVYLHNFAQISVCKLYAIGTACVVGDSLAALASKERDHETLIQNKNRFKELVSKIWSSLAHLGTPGETWNMDQGNPCFWSKVRWMLMGMGRSPSLSSNGCLASPWVYMKGLEIGEQTNLNRQKGGTRGV